MRLPKLSEMKDLDKLSSVRERAAMLELSEVAVRRQIALDRVHALRSDLPKTETIENGLVLQRWLIWRDQEVKKRLSALAVVSAEYAKTAQRCGRIIAESSVVEEMSKQVAIDIRDMSEKRRTYDQCSALHFLTHDVGDQDI